MKPICSLYVLGSVRFTSPRDDLRLFVLDPSSGLVCCSSGNDVLVFGLVEGENGQQIYAQQTVLSGHSDEVPLCEIN